MKIFASKILNEKDVAVEDSGRNQFFCMDVLVARDVTIWAQVTSSVDCTVRNPKGLHTHFQSLIGKRVKITIEVDE